jgi:hypothetical protein
MRKRLLIGLSIGIAGIAFFAFTNPATLPVGLLMVPILLAFGITTSIIYLLMHWFQIFQGNQHKQRGVSVLCGVVAAFYLVFQSTGGIVLGDAILLGLIFVIAYIYISKY